MEDNGIAVFNPNRNMGTNYTHSGTPAQQDAVKRSKIVFAAVSNEFFKSDHCKNEIIAAEEKGLLVVGCTCLFR